MDFGAINDLDLFASAGGHARSTIQNWFDAYRLGGVEALLKEAVPTTPVGPIAWSPKHSRRWRKGSRQVVGGRCRRCTRI